MKILEQADVGRVSHLLISPEELKRITENLNNQHYNEDVPLIDLLSTEFRKLVPISWFRHGFILNLEVTFPLFPITEFLLFKTYPVMIRQRDGRGAYIRLVTSHVAIGEGNNTYNRMSNLELSSCAKGAGAYYCQHPTSARQPPAQEVRALSTCCATQLRKPLKDAK